MGNVQVRFDFHFVSNGQTETVSTTQKIRRFRQLRDALNIVLANEAVKIPAGSWKVASYSAAPLKTVDIFERIRWGGAVVVYAEPGGNVPNGLDVKNLNATVTFDVRINSFQIAKYEIRVPNSTIIIDALRAFVRAHSCCAPDFEVKCITRNDALVSGCDRVQNKAVYLVELKSSHRRTPVEGQFNVFVSFIQDQEDREIPVTFEAEATIKDLKERLKFVRVDHVCFVDKQFDALTICTDTTMLLPGAKYVINSESTAADALTKPLAEFGKVGVKSEIMAPKDCRSVIVRRCAYGSHEQMGSLYDSRLGEFHPINVPVEELIERLSRQPFANIQLRSNFPPIDSWTLIDKCGLWEGELDRFGLEADASRDPHRTFHFLYERRTGVLSLDVMGSLLDGADLGTATHILSGAIMGVYFILTLSFGSDGDFDREAIQLELKSQLAVPKPADCERPAISARLHEAAASLQIRLHTPDCLNLATPESLDECRRLVDEFTVADGVETQLEHWLLPLHQIVPYERLNSVNILPNESEDA